MNKRKFGWLVPMWNHDTPEFAVRRKAEKLFRERARLNVWVRLNVWGNNPYIEFDQLSRRAHARLAGQSLGIVKRLERTIVAARSYGFIGIASTYYPKQED